MQPFRSHTGIVAPLARPDIDTDQIIPKQFLKTVERAGLAKGLFYDFRFDEQGREKPDFVLNQPAYKNAGVLITGDNFGCGSSREHAPWALVDFGFRAVVSTEIADIFRNNSLKNGLLTVIVDEATHAWLVANPGAEVEIDLDATTLRLPNGTTAKFPIEAFSRYCLLNGIDEFGYLLGQDAQISAYERTHSA